MSYQHKVVKTERAIARAAIAGILAAGYTISVDDGEEIVLRQSTDAKKIFDAMFSTDEDYLHVHKADAPARQNTREAFGWVRFVYGNDGWDVICDYTVNLESALEPAKTESEKHEKQLA